MADSGPSVNPFPIDAALTVVGMVMFFAGAMIALDAEWSLIAIGAMLIYTFKPDT